MAASASAARNTTRGHNGRNRQAPTDKGRVVEDDKTSKVGAVASKVKGTADDAWAATKAGLASDEAKLLYLQFGSGVAIGAGLTVGFIVVDKVFN
jgi:hypothetical protein